MANSASAFQSGFASGATLAQLQASVPLGFAAPTFSTVENQLTNPKYYEWNLEVQQSHRQELHGVPQLRGQSRRRRNQPGSPRERAIPPAGFQGLPTTAPDPRFGEIRELNSNGYSYYDGLVASFKWHLGHQFSGQFNYNWGHALDTCSNGCLEPFNALTRREHPQPAESRSALSALNYGDSDYDTRHTVSANYRLHRAQPFHEQDDELRARRLDPGRNHPVPLRLSVQPSSTAVSAAR